jgi:hypothetical protein
LLASGELSLTSIRMLGPHLTIENHESVLTRARGRRRRQIEALVAELAPRPDVPSSVRKLPNTPPAVRSVPVQGAQAEAIVAPGPPASLPRHSAAGSAAPADHRSDVAAALPRPVHDRGREPRQAAAPPDTSTPGDSRRRPCLDRGSCPDVAPGEGRTKEAGGGGQAEARAPYPPRGG